MGQYQYLHHLILRRVNKYVPVRSYTNWNKRLSDSKIQKEPYRKYFFICEGVNTETWYFKELINRRKQLHIHPMIDICLLEKTEEDRDISYPRKLIDFAEEQKDVADISFDKQRDKMIVVFDADIYENKVSGLKELVEENKNKNILGISNPAFELFLLLHFQGSVERIIKPNEKLIIDNKKVGNQRYIYKLLLDESGINSKKNSKIGELAKDIDIAIEQEKKINENIQHCKGEITCNIAHIIDEIRKDGI